MQQSDYKHLRQSPCTNLCSRRCAERVRLHELEDSTSLLEMCVLLLLLLLRWRKIKRLQGHLTVSDSVTVQTSVKSVCPLLRWQNFWGVLYLQTCYVDL